MGVHATSHNRGNHWAIDTKVIPKTVPQSQTQYFCANRCGLTTNAAQSWSSTSRLYPSLPMIKPSADPKHCNNRSSTHDRRPAVTKPSQKTYQNTSKKRCLETPYVFVLLFVWLFFEMITFVVLIIKFYVF